MDSQEFVAALTEDDTQEPTTHWLDQSHMMILRTGCGLTINSYAPKAYDATTDRGMFIHIAPHGVPSCKRCRVAYNNQLQSCS